MAAPEAATPAGALTGTIEVLRIESGGAQRSFWLYLPSSYPKSGLKSLVINFHGLEADAPGQQALSGMSIRAEAEGFVVAYPNGLDHAWRDGPGSPDVQFTRDLIAQLEKTYTIDPHRIFVTGISNGGGMANRVGCELAEVVAAIGPVAGAYNLWRVCSPSRPVPVVAFHGLADRVVPYAGAGQGNIAPPIHDWAAAWAKRNGCGPDPSATQVNADVTEAAWGGCGQGADVVLYTIADHGHSWPGSSFLPEITSQAIDATGVMWEFFKAHPLP